MYVLSYNYLRLYENSLSFVVINNNNIIIPRLNYYYLILFMLQMRYDFVKINNNIT